jgi:hypothetical protein
VKKPDIDTLEQVAKWLEEGAGEKESYWNHVYAKKLREQAQERRREEAYPTTTGTPSGPQDALQIVQQDRDYWKQRARQLELTGIGYPEEIDLNGLTDDKLDIEYKGKAKRTVDNKYTVLARVGHALCVVEVTLTPKPDALTKEYLKSLPGEFTINVNGKEHKIPKAVMTYEEVLKLAELEGNPTMVFHGKQSNGNKIAGSLIPGMEIGLVEGMRFQVVHTNNA